MYWFSFDKESYSSVDRALNYVSISLCEILIVVVYLYGNVVICTGKGLERDLLPHTLASMQVYYFGTKFDYLRVIYILKLHKHAWVLCKIWLLVYVGMWSSNKISKHNWLSIYPLSPCSFQVVLSKKKHSIQIISPPKIYMLL